MDKHTAPKPLRPKTKKLIEGIVAGKSHRRAALDAGFGVTPESASTLAARELSKVDVQEALQMALQEFGVTPRAVIQVVSDGMSAERTVILGNGDDAFADQVPDHSIRLKAAGLASKLMGIGQQATGSGPQFTVVINSTRDRYGI
jgi:hypothetical protein